MARLGSPFISNDEEVLVRSKLFVKNVLDAKKQYEELTNGSKNGAAKLLRDHCNIFVRVRQ